MQDRLSEVKASSALLNGLDDVFDADTTVMEGLAKPANTVVSSHSKTVGMTIKQASDHYGLAVPTIRLKIKTGEIAAKKVNGPKGPEWRVFPDGLPDADYHADSTEQHADISLSEGFYEADRTVMEGFHQAHINLAALIKANQDLTSKLEAASYRNGYLEAQLEEKEKRIELLTDSQRNKGWWAKFQTWFKGGGK